MLLHGARQVGKSELIRRFAKKLGLVLNEINLERHLNLSKAFGSFDIPRILDELSVVVGRKVDQKGSLLFLDEVQGVPEAIAALRYFLEDRPGLPVVASGALLDFALADRKIALPVGRVQDMYLGPMSFYEFLEEVDQELLPYCRMAVFEGRLPAMAHERLRHRVRQFMFVGGMPEAVAAYAADGLSAVPTVQNTLLETYESDFAKYAGGVSCALMQRAFRNLPLQACNKVKYVNFARESASRQVKAALNLLRMAGVCNEVRASACDGVPLLAGTEENVWKELFIDVGLMNRACGADWRQIETMDDTLLVNEGRMAEQFVGQHLLYLEGCRTRPQLAYWLREGVKNNAEVDFVVSSGQTIFPVEVRAGKSGSLKSVREMVLAKGYARAFRFDCEIPSRQQVLIEVGGDTRKYELISLPLYSVETLPELLKHDWTWK